MQHVHGVWVYSLSSKELHAKQGEDEDEEEEKEQETEDGTHTAQQRDDKVPQVGPVSVKDNGHVKLWEQIGPVSLKDNGHVKLQEQIGPVFQTDKRVSERPSFTFLFLKHPVTLKLEDHGHQNCKV